VCREAHEASDAGHHTCYVCRTVQLVPFLVPDVISVQLIAPIAMHRAAHVLRSAPKNLQHSLPRSKTMAVSRIWRNSRDIRTRVKPRADTARCVDLRQLVTASKAHVTKATSVPAE
jgi:hypothetical protein